MMVAAHNSDLKAAQKLGLKTAFVARPTEYGPLQKYDFEATGDWDIVAKDFSGIADGWGVRLARTPTSSGSALRAPKERHAPLGCASSTRLAAMRA